MLRPELAMPDQALFAEDSRPQRSASSLAWMRPVVAGGIFAGVLAIVIRGVAAPLSNDDTYFHLRFGSEFLHHWSLRHPGSVSTFATADWLPTQWLSEAVMARTEEWLGLAGVAWLFGVQLLALMTTLYLIARRWVDPLLAVLLTTAALVAASKGLSMRPQTLSFLLVAVTAAAWMRTREDGRLRWWLVPLTWVWAMLHGMWPVGIVLGLVAVAGLALDRERTRDELGKALLVPVLSAVAAGLTPVGPALYGAVTGVGSRAHYFAEWGTPDFTAPALVVLGLMLAVAVVLVVRRGRATWFDLAFLLTAGACAVWSWRTVPVAAVVLVPLIAAHALPADGREPPARPGRLELVLLAGALVLALGALGAAVPATADAPPAQPAWAEAELGSLPAGTAVLGEWDQGGYLMWRYPRLDLLMHGYGDTFTDAELQRNSDIVGLAPGWDDELRATGVRIAVLRPGNPLAYALEHQLRWKVLHRSPTLEELQAPAGW
jgi:hypothetical protein